MKTIKIYIIAILTFLLFFSGCIVNIVGDVNPTVPGDSPSVVKMVAAAVIAVYEVVVRIIPTVGDYSGISWVIKWLKRISDTLNVQK